MSCSGVCDGCQSCHLNCFQRGSCSQCWGDLCPLSCRPAQCDSEVVGDLWKPAIGCMTFLYTALTLAAAWGLYRIYRRGDLFDPPSSLQLSPLGARMLICVGCLLLAEGTAVAFVVFFHWSFWVFFWGRFFFYIAIYKNITKHWCKLASLGDLPQKLLAFMEKAINIWFYAALGCIVVCATVTVSLRECMPPMKYCPGTDGNLPTYARILFGLACLVMFLCMLGLFVTNAQASRQLLTILNGIQNSGEGSKTAKAPRELVQLTWVLLAGLVCALFNMALMLASVGDGITPSGDKTSKIYTIVVLGLYTFVEYFFVAIIVWVQITSQPRTMPAAPLRSAPLRLSREELEAIGAQLSPNVPPHAALEVEALYKLLSETVGAELLAIGPQFAQFATQFLNPSDSVSGGVRAFVGVMVWLRGWAMLIARTFPEVLPAGRISLQNAERLMLLQLEAPEACPEAQASDTDTSARLQSVMEKVAEYERLHGNDPADGVTVPAVIAGLEAVCKMERRREAGVWQAMDKPLAHYWICSSHNTEMPGHSLTSSASIEMLQLAMLMGCRCLELDLWDDAEGQPVVSHGPTTGSVTLLDALLCIKRYAFTVSSYPLIISLDNSCSTQAQTKTAETIEHVLGNLLASSDYDVTASPADLQNKIIIRGKRLAAEKAGTSAGVSSSEQVEDENASEESDVSDSFEANSLNSSKPDVEDGLNAGFSSPKRSVSDSLRQLKQLMRSKAPVSPALSKLVMLESTRLPVSLQAAPDMTYSVAWARTELALADPAELHAWSKFARHSLVRVFPQSMDCCNFDPNDSIRAGIQMVALNFQTAGREREMLLGWFKQNGGCGYVLKPDRLGDLPLSAPKLEEAKVTGDSRSIHCVPSEPGVLLHLGIEFGWDCSIQSSAEEDVYVDINREIAALETSGQGTHFSIPSQSGSDTQTHLWVEMSGQGVECKRIRTKQVEACSGVTAWHEDFVFAFESRNTMELASCYMAVVGDKHAGVIAEGCFAVRSLRCGDSVAQLRQQHNPECHASVLCHIRTEEKHMMRNDLINWQSNGSVESHVLEAIGIDLC